MVVKFGPVKASFNSNVGINSSGGPGQFKRQGKGDAGVAGFAKGGADVRLADNECSTLLICEVNIDIGSTLAQVGSRLIEGASKRLAKKVLSNIEDALPSRLGNSPN